MAKHFPNKGGFMKNVKARAMFSPTDKFKQTTIDRRDVGPKDILIEIKFAGICHSDIHTAKQEWGEIKYPIVPGHEIAGIVAEVGSEVSKYKVGDRGASALRGHHNLFSASPLERRAGQESCCRGAGRIRAYGR
jgi:D-arabinose 1-dehydrogenase-like Zn-dependent alcohol dehydrogenase